MNATQVSFPSSAAWLLPGVQKKFSKKERIFRMVLREYEMKEDEIKTKSNKPYYTMPRYMVAFLLDRATSLNLSDMGRIFITQERPKGLDHATIIHGIKVIKTEIQTKSKTGLIALKLIAKLDEL